MYIMIHIQSELNHKASNLRTLFRPILARVVPTSIPCYIPKYIPVWDSGSEQVLLKGTSRTQVVYKSIKLGTNLGNLSWSGAEKNYTLKKYFKITLNKDDNIEESQIPIT